LSADLLHAAWVDEDGSLGAVQKNATVLPPGGYSDADLRPSTWSGTTILLDAAFDLELVFGSTATVDAGGNFTSSGNGVTASTPGGGAPLTVVDPTFGLVDGDFSDTAGNSGVIVGLMTPDKQFAAVHAVWPADSAYSAWTRT
jgi:hypothetical protein